MEGKMDTERQREYRERNILAIDTTKSRLSILISDHAMIALQRLAKHSGITQAVLLERVLLEEQRRIIAGRTDPEADAFYGFVTP